MYTLKKSLGQHFLKDERICERIALVLQERPFKNLLEIGPGGGALTKYLIGIPGINFKCIEVDGEKVEYLLKTYPSLGGRIIHGDFLQTAMPFEDSFTVIGNFPYNLSTQIVFKILEWRASVDTMIGMFQKEVALRIAAKEGSKIYGVTSVLTQAFFKAEYLFEVDEQAFNPPPKVKSAVIRLIPLDEPAVVKSQRAFTTLVKTAFNQRRKTLRNAVKPLFSEEELKDVIFNKRAEQLSVKEFAALSFRMQGK
ncbi:MAG TPA: 16S rRNA (adenine(1518)-N(6)/adenine(1519)-N(6))-dimethyltransferase RsmA [Flavitalea sp.]|nr:16S rRNA (adenine(1518)-N(6)/adenine(1519)-N(6))-dimethyltransferase RsmA [Flavitalea sp.]